MGSSPSKDNMFNPRLLVLFLYKNSSDHYIKQIARLAQLVERKTFNLVVVGSSPTEGKLYIFFFINSLVGRVVKAADLRSVGR